MGETENFDQFIAADTPGGKRFLPSTAKIRLLSLPRIG